ncbi:hypothetical protein WP12_04670 [Sphingomonas sp. SRS2]|nr:hypothetical protein WP12_04670 [Sphingomonas sp. SRS2]
MTNNSPPPPSGTGPAITTELTTGTGLRLKVRPVTSADEPALAKFFRQVTAEDLRFRFLTAIDEVSHARLVEMISVDQDQVESFLVTGPDEAGVLAAAMLAANPAGERAEVAISIRADYKGRGIGWSLLGHLADHARRKGIRILESIESRDNHSAIALEREMGFTAHPVEGDPAPVLLRRQLA